MRVIRGAFLFIAGLVVGLAVEVALAQNSSPNKGIVGLNHVCIVVPNLDEAVNYYTKTLGFPEAFRSKDDKMADDFPDTVYRFYTGEDVASLLQKSGFERDICRQAASSPAPSSSGRLTDTLKGRSPIGSGAGPGCPAARRDVRARP